MICFFLDILKSGNCSQMVVFFAKNKKQVKGFVSDNITYENFEKAAN